MALRWGIIGCGDVCEIKSGPALYEARGSELAVVMRRSADKAADFARRHGVARFTTNAEEVIGDPGVDIVYVATPPGEHERYALLVAQANKPCYVEKPMARSGAECRRMIEAFERARQPLFVAYYRRALPRFAKVRELLESQALGRLLTVSHVYQGRKNPKAAAASAGWREDVAQSGGGLFVDLGSHVVDVLDHLLGPLLDVNGQAARLSDAPGARRGLAEDTVVMSFRTTSGALGTGRYQFHTAGSVDRLELVGTRGALALSVFGREPLELTIGDARELIEVEQPEHVHQPLVQTIVDELAGQGRCPSTGQSAERASLVIDRVLDGYYGGRSDAFWSRPETWPGPARE
jgi:1,5-anhydro-D-fructose reductase (1,5-anhydro-D-mannitol-forming)